MFIGRTDRKKKENCGTIERQTAEESQTMDMKQTDIKHHSCEIPREHAPYLSASLRRGAISISVWTFTFTGVPTAGAKFSEAQRSCNYFQADVSLEALKRVTW